MNNKTGAVTLAKGDVGLGNVDNTSDANKPISNATQAALNGKQSKITANGILKGDGAGNITPANETEVELVSLPNICNPNLLDNWYFGKPVNQRGQTSYTGSGYTIDRWIRQGSNIVTTLNEGYVSVVGYGGNLDQILEGDISKYLRGKEVTLSTLARGNIAIISEDFTGSYVVAYLQSETFTVVSKTITVRSDADRFIYHVQPQDGDPSDVIAVKLELGSQQTLAHQENGVWVLNEIPDYGEQLRRCQRYYWKVDHNSWPGVAPFTGTYDGERILLNGLTFPVTMRTKPTISNLILYERGSGASKTVTDSGWGLFDYTYNIYPTSGNLVSGHTYSVQHVEFSADL